MSGTSREDEYLLDATRRGGATAGGVAAATTRGINDDLGDEHHHQTILDVVGGEVSNVIFPVAACIAITSALVQLLDPDGSTGNLGAGTWASAAYKEKPTDSDATKALGAFENAAVFVAFIAAITFLLVLAFKHGATRLIKLYMALSGFSIFAVLWGLLSIQAVATLRLPLDAYTYSITLWNFAVVGTAALFVLDGSSKGFPKSPLALRQCYLVAVGVATAFAFASSIPEWTTWALLIGMACYDLWAVLHPTGPLKLLLDAAQERDEDIPALIYEAGPSSSSSASRSRGGGARGGGGGGGGNSGGVALGTTTTTSAAGGERGRAGGLPLGVTATSTALLFSSLSMALGTMARRNGGGRGQRGRRGRSGDNDGGEEGGGGGGGGGGGRGGEGQEQRAEESAPSVSVPSSSSTEPAPSGGPADPLLVVAPERSGEQRERQQQRQRQRQRSQGNSDNNGNNDNNNNPSTSGSEEEEEEEEHENFFFPRDHRESGIKLGMGDFIFYSVLVGRASMYDGMAALAAAAAVIAGLGATLLLLALRGSALPALPISIALGAVCTAAARFCLEPVVMPLAGSMLFF